MILKLPTEGLLSPPPPAGRHKTHPERASEPRRYDCDETVLFSTRAHSLRARSPGGQAGAGGVSFGLCGARPPGGNGGNNVAPDDDEQGPLFRCGDGGGRADDGAAGPTSDVRCPLLRCPNSPLLPRILPHLYFHMLFDALHLAAGLFQFLFKF